MQINLTINIDDRLVAWTKRVFRRKVVTRGLVGLALGSALVVYAAPALTTFVAGTPVSAGSVNANFAALQSASWSVAANNIYYLVPDAGPEDFVGIGTASPVADLHVYSPSGNAQVAMFESAETTNGTFIGFTDHSAGGPYTQAEVGSVDGNLKLSGNTVIVAGSTNLGVRMGAGTPDIPLQVASGTVLDLDAGTGYFQIGGDSVGTDDNLVFDYHTIQARTASGANKGLNINPFGGTVTLGSTTANANLTVDGNASATGNISATGNMSATGTIAGSNLPSSISFVSTGGDNGSVSCQSYCTRSPFFGYCVSAYLISTGAYETCTSTAASTLQCLCAVF